MGFGEADPKRGAATIHTKDMICGAASLLALDTADIMLSYNLVCTCSV